MAEVIIWGDLKGREARGVSKEVDLGEVREIGRHYIMTQKGVIGKEKFYIPKYLVDGYDGETLWFNITEGQKSDFVRDGPPAYEEYDRYRVKSLPADIETYVHIIEKKKSE